MNTRNQHILVIALIALILAACASRGYPEGGEKDSLPPVVERSSPAANAVNFKGKEVTIFFDELIKVDAMDEKFVSSPPLKKHPTIVARGKRLVIVFDEDLQPNATYTLDFSDAISDYNESNKLKDFRFSFSTGAQIDTFAISGNLFDAFTLAPIAGGLILLYSNLSDTIFRTEVPLRIAKTDNKGFFSIHNIGQGKYRVYGLNDANRNYFFDQPGEEIAWNGDTIVPSVEYQTVRDTMMLKTIVKTDSIKLDSLFLKKVKVDLPNNIQLFMYQEDFVKQYLLNSNRKERSKIDLCFSKPIVGDLELRLNTDSLRPLSSWAIRQNSLKRDTISFLITDTLVSNTDSLAFSLRYNTTDSLNRQIAKLDTFVTYFIDLPIKKKKPKKGEVIVLPTLVINGLSSSHDIYLPYSFNLSSPAVQFNSSGIKLFEKRDTIKTEIPFELVKDTTIATRYFVKKKWEYKVSYSLTIDSATFTNSYGLVNKKVNVKFDINPENSYGILFLTLENGAENSLVQLIDAQENVIRQQYAPKNGKMAFQLLRPGTYYIKLVDDQNHNKKYDIGNYALGIKPEKVIYYPEVLSIRANWRHDVKWDASIFDIYKFVKTFRAEAKKKK